MQYNLLERAGPSPNDNLFKLSPPRRSRAGGRPVVISPTPPESPVAIVLLNELESLDKELRIATGQRPKLEAYLAELTGKADGIAGDIKQKEAELSAAISANEVIAPDGHPQQRSRAGGRPYQPVPGNAPPE